ncbi:MAG TPA: rod shape-determining protein MreD [Rhizomicrobium sp.]|jgi:rod shape-determining protein MreD
MVSLERAGTPTRLRFLIVLTPLLCGLFCAFLTSIPVSVLGGLVPPPLLALVPVYFWCLVRPDLMSPAVALAIGFAEDVLSGGPPGVWTLSFVLTYALVARYRDSFAGLSGLAAVVGFSAAATFACVTAWFIVATLAFLTPGAHSPPIGPSVSELAMTVIFYAPTVLVVSWLHHKLVGASRGDV